MNNKKIEEIFDRLVERVSNGEDIESCLRDYPRMADELRPLLNIALKIENLPKPQPESDALAKIIASVRNLAIAKKPERRLSIRKIFLLHPTFVRTALAILIVLILGVTSVRISADSLPGNPLYPVKILSEKIHYAITFNEKGKAELHILFADRRTYEFASIFKTGEQIDRSLLTRMLAETAQAYEKSQNLTDREADIVKEKIMECNAQQIKVLENTKQYACQCDIETIIKAISSCKELHECLRCEPGSCGSIDCTVE